MNMIKKIKIKLTILLLGNKKKYKNINLKDVKTVLLSPKDALGDTLISFSHARQLRKMYPYAKIGIVSTIRNKNFIKLINQKEKVFDEIVDRKKIIRHRKKWDLLLDFKDQINTKRLIWTKILKPKIIISFGKDKAGHYFSRKNIKIYDFVTAPPEKAHIVDYLMYSEFSKYFNIEKEIPKLELNGFEVSKMVKNWNLKRRKIKILLAPQGNDRCIKIEELAKFLNDINFENVKFIMSKTSGSEKYFEKLTSLLKSNIDISLSKAFSIEEYVNFLASSDIVVGVDSGSVHIACALKKPVLSFYANNEANLYRWSPVPNKNVDSLQIISNIAGTQNDLYDFPMEDAVKWLNIEINKIYGQSER
ncbi:glycosyltransferase family 9 protein [Leptotrichia sp. oral taxon 847]|uniref:glycosyltransferase family 9 protein n=1 Tax=Leptotrichia sp. oral taxon 847 TaxID=1785996 RepID=UPI0007681273|nr:glycosyltransferase family 9 protein [Leptotrichia sp. oral taxon 847]AMD95093.1 hypothetical protein AXF11_05565 [Leptotrichia sp. oral taxon 847]